MMITCGISLAACSILLRRIFDTVSGTAAIVPDSTPHAATIAVCSTALYGIYHQLRWGMLVNVGNARPQQTSKRSPRHLNHGSTANTSWFFRNLWGGRKRCTDAICKVAREYLESVKRVDQQHPAHNSAAASTSRSAGDGEVIVEVRAPSTAKPSILKKPTPEAKKTKPRKAVGRPRSVAKIDEMQEELHKPKRTRLKRSIKRKKVKSTPQLLDTDRRTRSGRIYNLCN